MAWSSKPSLPRALPPSLICAPVIHQDKVLALKPDVVCYTATGDLRPHARRFVDELDDLTLDELIRRREQAHRQQRVGVLGLYPDLQRIDGRDLPDRARE